MWIVIYIFIGILYYYLLSIPLFYRVINNDTEIYAALFIICILASAGIQLYNKIFKTQKKMKCYQLIIGIILSFVSFFVTFMINGILIMREM